YDALVRVPVVIDARCNQLVIIKDGHAAEAIEQARLAENADGGKIPNHGIFFRRGVWTVELPCNHDPIAPTVYVTSRRMISASVGGTAPLVIWYATEHA